MSYLARTQAYYIDAAKGEKTYFHVTEKDNWYKIKTQGLKPRIGTLAKEFGESAPAIYLFTSEEDADTALAQWLGDELADLRGIDPEDLQLVMLKVTVPSDFPIQDPKSTSEYEAVSYEKIPPRYIRFLKDA